MNTSKSKRKAETVRYVPYLIKFQWHQADPQWEEHPGSEACSTFTVDRDCTCEHVLRMTKDIHCLTRPRDKTFRKILRTLV